MILPHRITALPLLRIALLVALPLAPGLSWSAPGEALREAAAYLTAGDFQQARDRFNAASEANPQSAVALVGSGAAHLFLGDTQQTRELCTQALVLSPDLPCAHIGLATALSMLGDHQGAMSHYRSALIAGAQPPSLALAGQAHAACALGLYDTAMQHASAALATDSQQPLARYVLAAAAFARGDPRPAAQLTSGGAAHRPQYASPVFLQSCLLSPGSKRGS